jgi:hypothetical protein
MSQNSVCALESTKLFKMMNWYAKMDKRTTDLCVVPEKVEECEGNKNKLQSENDGSVLVIIINF